MIAKLCTAAACHMATSNGKLDEITAPRDKLPISSYQLKPVPLVLKHLMHSYSESTSPFVTFPRQELQVIVVQEHVNGAEGDLPSFFGPRKRLHFGLEQ